MDIFNFLLERKPVPDFAEMLYGENIVKNNITEIVNLGILADITLPQKENQCYSGIISKIGRMDEQLFLLVDSIYSTEQIKMMDSAGYALFSYEIDGAPHGFFSKFISFNKEIEKFVFSFPVRIFKIQRRSSYRLSITTDSMLYLQISICGREKIYDVSDISEEGIGFFTDDELSSERDGIPLVYSGEIIFPDDNKLEVKLVVKRVSPNKSESAAAIFQAGAEFLDLGDDKKDRIAQYIFERQKDIMNTRHIKIKT